MGKQIVRDYSKKITNQAINFVKSNPCSICSREDAQSHKCGDGFKYKGTCPVWINLKCALIDVKEVEE